ncbi:recombinase family protein [Enterobacterales bacterium AE_CKDN230030158-1A_HGKHYDSX7]
MPTAYSYIRFSSPEQAKGDSHRRQQQAAEQYCRDNGLELAADSEYTFFDSGRSAYSGKHLSDEGELKRFLDLVESGSIPPGSVLIVESLDRLSREHVKSALPRFLDLLAKSIVVVTLADGRRYDSDYNELDLIVSIVTMSRAHEESRTKGQRVSSAWKEKQRLARENRTPLGAACPYWLEYRDGAYHRIPERIKVVQHIFQLSQSGHGQRLIAKLLNESGTPVFGSANRNKSGAWGSSSVNKILENKALLGYYQPTNFIDGKRLPSGEPVPGFFPAVIDEETFYAAQAARNLRKVSKATRPAKEFNLWAGVAKCRQCGEPMHLVNKGKPPKGAKYLRCYGAVKGTCGNKHVRLDRSEFVFREVLAKVDSLALVQDNTAALGRALAASEGKSSDISERLTSLQQQILTFGAKIPPTLVQTLAALDNQLTEETATQERLRADIARETIASKDDFFNRLDLVSFAGRSAANAVLKRLRLNVYIRSSGPNACSFDVSSTMPNEFKGKWPLMRFLLTSNDIYFQPFTTDSLQRGITQGDAPEIDTETA